ncbi:N-acetyldiaminopimelate deacetylase [[Clostridium] bifermentans ATCC 638]|uniref:N-acetyldiaminopimelate deacetylase n=1 Tax=Paraclostridium bifermentans ATCC 638 = DSM 14991 TaxID=1233171 RepID=T4VIJ8_PARBF|nr:N-acetyldiaminopimelate deacetylase [Paraclostridium bifermentans]EQK41318.1 N-acetyldiaminopimelate deacetylase [[Clostridium] bifermentans ATCC 638] [Paraclostridium bifermentans ATCC 638 = DSM 14991]RIZ59005.1 amidohydrolase [Paraclostridium bifermentans]UAG18475.1 N-acetyldiaminopimelate deacetylase [Paraclostridium bifermentans]
MENICNIKECMKNNRKELHVLAEIGNQEFKTSKYIKDYLNNIGVEYEEMLDTAVVGIIKGKNPKKTIAFRSDMDALTLGEKAMHLCGHDGHMSILLGLVTYLNENRENLMDNIVFIFQPAEEGPGGAKPLINAGIVEKYKIDEIYGLHIYPEIPEGYVGTRPNYFLAQVGELDIDIIAKSGHGAMPQNGIDGIVLASSFISSLQTIVSRNISPLDNAVLTIGKMHGGTRRNIIAENIRIEGTIRAFKPEVYETIKERIRELAKGYEVAYNCKIEVEIRDDYPAVNNNEVLFEEFEQAIGSDKLIKLEPIMISEDFSYYQQVLPGLFFMLGARNEEKGFVNGLHSLNFNFDENILGNALDVYIKLLKYKKSIL